MANNLQSFIAEGFADDIDELIHRCLQEVPVTYKVFANIFRSMQFSSIFLDRQSEAELAELSEEVITMAKYYMVANTGCFEETVVGLFLVYALVQLQPFKDFAYLRLVEEDVPFIERIEQVARRNKRVDVLYVLARLLIENTRYHAAARERGMEPSYRKYIEGCSPTENLGLRPKGVFLRQNEELDIISELDKLQIQYDQAKLAGGFDLSYTNSKFATELDHSLNNIISGIIHEDSSVVDAEEAQDTVRSIKERAMKNKVNPIKHLIGVGDRSPDKRMTNHSTTSIKASPGKVKTGSPLKKLPTSKRRLQRISEDTSDSDEESNLVIDLSDNEIDSTDLDLGLFNKETPTNEINEAEVEIDSNKFNIGNLPCFMSSEDNGTTYEIEIIDKYNKQSTNNCNVKRKRIEITGECSVLKKARAEKRDLKKTILKSRFKRMGIEPIANFDGTT